ncbi:MAG: hypothetical protein FWC60_01305, partial [Firmicutes bacterium]|nr:hypothetical protein [Bacillota bacterium]
VTRKIDGTEASFCIIGFYTEQQSREKMAILAMLDPNSVLEVPMEELAPVKFKKIIALTTNISFMH